MLEDNNLQDCKLEEVFKDIYEKFSMNFYSTVFRRFETREATLTSIETVCAEVINALDRPTINQVAYFLNVSQPNMTYKINSLVKKGYVRKVTSKEDQRAVFLEVTDKFKKYEDIKKSYINLVLSRTRKRLSKEDLEKFQEILKIINDELMFEISDQIKGE